MRARGSGVGAAKLSREVPKDVSNAQGPDVTSMSSSNYVVLEIHSNPCNVY